MTSEIWFEISALHALLANSAILQYNTIQLIFDITLLPYTCQAQQCSYASDLVAQMQWYCTAIVCKELDQDPYTVTVSDEARTCTLHIKGRAL